MSYASAMAPDIASERMERIRKAGVEKITFAWAGEAARGQRHYYRVQGPTFLIEYDNTQNDAQPHPLGLARFPGRLRARPAARAPEERRALSLITESYELESTQELARERL